MKHLVIPDIHSSEESSSEHLEAIGNMIVERKPDVVVQIGDFADMQSLCSYNNRLQFEGTRYARDLEVVKEDMFTMLRPLYQFNSRRIRNRKAQWWPRMVLTLGNHEYRIQRLIEEDPRLIGSIGLHDLEYEEFGWEVYPFLQPVNIENVNYVHYAQQLNSSNAITRAHLIASRRFGSFTVGHTQGLDYYCSNSYNPRIQCIVAGSCYLHEPSYLSPQGNEHWRGIVFKNNVYNGTYDPEFISINSLIQDWL